MCVACVACVWCVWCVCVCGVWAVDYGLSLGSLYLCSLSLSLLLVSLSLSLGFHGLTASHSFSLVFLPSLSYSLFRTLLPAPPHHIPSHLITSPITTPAHQHTTTRQHDNTKTQQLRCSRTSSAKKQSAPSWCSRRRSPSSCGRPTKRSASSGCGELRAHQIYCLFSPPPFLFSFLFSLLFTLFPCFCLFLFLPPVTSPALHQSHAFAPASPATPAGKQRH